MARLTVVIRLYVDGLNPNKLFIILFSMSLVDWFFTKTTTNIIAYPMMQSKQMQMLSKVLYRVFRSTSWTMLLSFIEHIVKIKQGNNVE